MAAPIELDGAYHAVKVMSGLNRVAVYYTNPAAGSVKRSRIKPKAGEPPPPPPPPPAPPFLTPDIYASVDTSTLSIQVDKEGAVFNVDLIGPEIP